MTLDLPGDPSLKDLQLPFESQYWYKAKATWVWKAKSYEEFIKFFGDDRKPRDIFRADVSAFKEWMVKKGYGQNRIRIICDNGSSFYHLLNDLELVEKDFNPFFGMSPRKIIVKPRP
jgi:hypothetical protein